MGRNRPYLPGCALILLVLLAGCASSRHPPEQTFDASVARETWLAEPAAESPSCPTPTDAPADGVGPLPEAPEGAGGEAFSADAQIPAGEAEDVSFLNDLGEPTGAAGPDRSVPIETNERVQHFLELFQGPQKRWMARALQRSGRYIDRMKEIFREEGLPEDLVYLAVVESGFNPYAYSRASAMGVWQFIPSTGRNYGLVVNWWLDERRDLEKSTRAAARYLSKLYDIFQDWYLAAAAYNAGEGKVLRAIRKYDSKCFWDISRYRYLKRETKNYVPRFLAALMIAKEPERYGFGDVTPEAPLLYETVALSDATDMAVVAEGCGVSLALLHKMNPQLQRGCTPPAYPDYEVKIPLGTRERFVRYYAQLDAAKRLTFRRHRVRPGETLSHVARRHGVSVHAIVTMNHLKSKHRIRAGKSLIIPIPARHNGSGHTLPGAPPVRKVHAAAPPLADGQRRVIHVVRRGDSLWDLSRQYEVRLATLMRWNGLRNSSRIYPGQRLVVGTAPRPVEAASPAEDAMAPPDRREFWHVVRSGDTLWGIAKKYHVTVSQLARWNHLDARNPIRPGLRLRVYRNAQLNADSSAWPAVAVPD